MINSGQILAEEEEDEDETTSLTRGREEAEEVSNHSSASLFRLSPSSPLTPLSLQLLYSSPWNPLSKAR